MLSPVNWKQQMNAISKIAMFHDGKLTDKSSFGGESVSANVASERLCVVPSMS